ncbi:MAG: type II secretion system protein [Planctomycetota bacterium]|jgi:prepilin-type N-terminal cleavage/methylation domain-containing protein|nr:type II secretion system protein [Planctomycetota bacterium]
MQIHSAFTLIELLVAVAISTVILLVSVTAFQAVDRSYRMATEMREENRHLVSSYQTALAEADTWLAVDDPASGAASTSDLRPHRTGNRPLSPLSMPAAAWRYQPHDPRWWHAGGARAPRNDSPRYFPGDWPQGNKLAYQSGTPFATAAPGTAAFNPRRFLPDLQHSLYTAAGIAAVATYLPRGLPIGYFSGSGANGRSWDVFRPGRRPDQNYGYFNHAHIQYAWGMHPRTGSWNWTGVGVNADGTEGWMADVGARFLYDNSREIAVLIPPRKGWSNLNEANPDNIWSQDAYGKALLYARDPDASDTNWKNALWYKTATGWGNQAQDAFTTGYPNPHRDSTAVIRTTAGVFRYMDGDGWHSQVTLKVIDTTSHRYVTRSFPILATTLRGARMQRGLDTTP